MNQAQIFIERIGIALIIFGVMFAIINWICLFAHLKLKREGANRNISMVALMGFSLPVGFLFFDALRPHALWIWLLDPASASLIFLLGKELVQEIQARSQK